MVIIVGSSSFIGSHLHQHFLKKGNPVMGTHYKSPHNDSVYFDLRKPNLSCLGEDLSRHKYVFICSAISHPDECKRNEVESGEINVNGTIDLVKQCFGRGLFPIFFSSEYVFNGNKGNYNEADIKSPNTVYGKQKAILEDFLLSRNERFLIARLGKVFGLERDDNTILTSIARGLREGKSLKCARDQIFNPTYVGDLINLLETSISHNLSGLYNMASPESFSRYGLAKLVQSELGITNAEVIPCSINEFSFLDNRPMNTSLDSSKILSETGFKFLDIREHTCRIRDSQI